MSPTFTTDDIGKTVESAAGDTLGVVAAVDQATAYIEPDPGVADSIKAVADWQSDSEPAVPLADDSVREVTEETIVLEAEFPDESITTAATDEGGSSDDRVEGAEKIGKGEEGEEDERREIGYSRGEPVADTVIETETDVTGRDSGAGTGDLDASEPTVDDEFYDAPEGGARVDPDDEMDDLEVEAETEPESGSEPEPESETAAEEIDSVEAAASRETDVDPSELTADEPETEIDPHEDVGERTDVGTPVDDVSDADIDSEPGGPTTEDGRSVDHDGDVETKRHIDGDRDRDEDGEDEDNR